MIAVFTTCGSREEAAKISQTLVERRMVACAQISEIESCYTWNGAIQREREWRLLLKTLADRYAEVEAAIRTLHSYDIPAIYAVPVTHVSRPYADWVAQSVGVQP
jgi:periplasmic divalent cation tolerance protein